MWAAVIALALAAALLPGLWTLPALSGMLLCLLILLKPEVAVYLLTISVPLGSLLEVEADDFSITTTEVLVALMVLGWIARAAARRSFTIPLTPVTLPLVAMLAVMALSGFQATQLSLTLKETLKWLELVLVFLFIVSEMRSAGQVITLLLLLLAGGTMEALLGFAQFALGLGPDSFAIGQFMRAFGTFEQPNPYAGYLGMLIPLGVGLLLTGPPRGVRVFAAAACILGSAAVLMSLSRGAWVGIALGLASMMLLWNHRTAILLAVAAIAATPIAALAFLNVLPDEVSSRLATALDYFRFVDVTQETVTSQNWAVIERVAHWQAALDMISQNPLLGVGGGNYPAVYEWYAVPGWPEALGHAHNYYLNIAAETGILGLLVYLAIPMVAIAHAVKWLARSSGDGRAPVHVNFWRGILVGTLGALVASSVHNMFDSLFVHSMSVQLGMILAMAQLSARALAGQPISRGHGEARLGGEPAL